MQQRAAQRLIEGDQDLAQLLEQQRPKVERAAVLAVVLRVRVMSVRLLAHLVRPCFSEVSRADG